MEFGWSAEDLAFAESVTAFAKKELVDDIARRDRAGEFPRELWRACGRFGIQGLPVPKEFGGRGLTALSTAHAMEALSAACPDAGFLFALSAQMWIVEMPITRVGSEEQKRRLLPGLCDGTLVGALAMSEPGSGSDAFSLQTRAEAVDGGYRLTGTKTFVSEGPVADVFVIFATIDPSLGLSGITPFLVERDRPGLHVGEPVPKMGLRTSPMSEISFSDCRIPAENRLGREGRGAQLFNDTMEWARSCILALAVGAMRRQLDASVKYAQERKQFGVAIGTYQSVQRRLVEMKVLLEGARMALYRAIWAKQEGKDAGSAAAIAKLVISEAWVQSGLHAVQVRGGYGYTESYGAERDLRDAVGSLLFAGTVDMQQNLIARALGL
ncbi:MAG TPA: acyl-CoA dehydrogenase family protein [Gemmatimonadales bacterium]|nr:acyl-CoA dehydrogenase family protein [Gemmatimonadales bacterium]